MTVTNPSTTARTVSPSPAPTPIVQSFSTAARTHTAGTAVAVDTTAAALVSFGLTEAQMNGVVAAINALILDVGVVKQVLNAVVDDCQAAGVSA